MYTYKYQLFFSLYCYKNRTRATGEGIKLYFSNETLRDTRDLLRPSQGLLLKTNISISISISIYTLMVSGPTPLTIFCIMSELTSCCVLIYSLYALTHFTHLFPLLTHEFFLPILLIYSLYSLTPFTLLLIYSLYSFTRFTYVLALYSRTPFISFIHTLLFTHLLILLILLTE